MNINSKYLQLLQILKTKSKQLHTILTTYGYSQPQINTYLITLIFNTTNSNNHNKKYRQPYTQQQQNINNNIISNNSQLKYNITKQNRYKFEQIILDGLSKNTEDIQRYLSRIIRILEIQLYQLYKYKQIEEQQNIQIQKQIYKQRSKQKVICYNNDDYSDNMYDSNKSLSISTSQQIVMYKNKNMKPKITPNYNNNNKNYNNIIQQSQSIPQDNYHNQQHYHNHHQQQQSYRQIQYTQQIQQHQRKLKNSLKHMVQKTKLLRAMLQRQMILSSIQSVANQRNLCYGEGQQYGCNDGFLV